MEALDFDHTLFTKQDAGDDSLLVVFYLGTIRNEAKSLEAGRPIIDDVECVRIMIPGDKNSVVDRPVEPNDKRRFPKQYAAFKAGGSEDAQLSGTRLKEWPYLSRGQCEELAYLGIKTVEQLAEVRDDIVARVPGLLTMKRTAATWIERSKGTAEAAKIAKTLQEQSDEIATLKKVIADMGAREDARLKERAKA